MITAHMATVTGFKIGDFLNLGKQLIAQIKIENDDDALDCLIINNPGCESSPMSGDRIPVLSIGNFYLSIGGTDEIEPTIEEGEKLLYSRDGDGAFSAFIRFLQNGDLNLNGDSDNVVRFSDLDTAISNMVDSINNAITTAITGHTHPGVVSGPSSTGSGSGSGSSVTADISDSKVKTVFVPSFSDEGK